MCREKDQNKNDCTCIQNFYWGDIITEKNTETYSDEEYFRCIDYKYVLALAHFNYGQN